MATTQMDLEAYLGVPQLTLAGTVTLAETLLKHSLNGTTDMVRIAHARLAKEAEAAHTAMMARQRYLSNREASRQEVDRRASNAWRAMHESLSALARLPEDRFPTAVRAQWLLSTIFPEENLDFLQRRYVDKYTVMNNKIMQIQRDDLLDPLVALLGESFWTEILYTAEAYRIMVQDSLDGVPSDSDLLKQLRQLRNRIADYTYKVVASADVEDPLSLESAARRLWAISKARALVRRSQRGATVDPSSDQDGQSDSRGDSSPSEESSGERVEANGGSASGSVIGSTMGSGIPS